MEEKYCSKEPQELVDELFGAEMFDAETVGFSEYSGPGWTGRGP